MDELLRRTKAFQVMGISRTTAWRRERDDPTFPVAIQCGPCSFRYRVADIQKWIDSRPLRIIANEVRK